MEQEGVYYFSPSTHYVGCTVENVPTPPPNKASLNASLYTAVEGGNKRNRAETPHPTDPTQPLDTIALNGKNRQQKASCVNSLNYHSGGQGIRHSVYKCLQGKRLEQSEKSGVIKSVIDCDTLANKQLSDVISAWSILPPNIRNAVLLLIQQYVQ